MSIRLDLDITGKGFTFDGNKLTTDWDEESHVEKRENGIYLYDVAGGLDNWTIVPYSGSVGIKTNEEVVQYIYAFSRFPVDEENRDAQSLKFLTEYEKSTDDVINEINWLHNNGYPQRAQWFPKEHDLMIFKGVGVPLDIHELYGDLVNQTCEDGLRYPDSVCEALFVIERVLYTDSDARKLPIVDMDIRCLWSSENCNVKPGELLPKNRTSYSGTYINRSPDGVVGNYYAFDFIPATFPPYDANAASSGTTVIANYPSYGYWDSNGVYTVGIRVNVPAGTPIYSTSTGSASSNTLPGNFYELFYGAKKTTYTDAGYSFGDLFDKGIGYTSQKKPYLCEVAVEYDEKTDIVTLKNGYKFPLWYLRNVKYNIPSKDDMCYVICPDHYDEDGDGCWKDGTKLLNTFNYGDDTDVNGRLPSIGEFFKCTSVDATGLATVEPWNVDKGVGYTFQTDVHCLAKANHYYYGHYDEDMWTNIRSIGDSYNRMFYPSLVSVKEGAAIEYVQCGTCVDPDHIWEFTTGTNPYGTQPMLVLRTFDKLNKALVTPATISKIDTAKYKPDYAIEYGPSCNKQNYAIAVSMDDLEVITLNYEPYISNTQSQTSSLPISDDTYNQYSTSNYLTKSQQASNISIAPTYDDDDYNYYY